MVKRKHKKTKIQKSDLDMVKMKVDVNGNELLGKVVQKINSNSEIKTMWKIMNVNAIDRLGYSDHGPTHFQFVSNHALKIARIFQKRGIKFSIVNDFGLTNDHAEAVIFLASIMHDLGMSIHRVGHETFSLFLADRLLQNILDFLPVEEKTVVISETLHAIISHSHGSMGETSTIEGGIVRVADALDMTKGRSRIAYGKRHSIDIFNVSNAAIEKVEVLEGKKKPVEIKIVMTNPAGIFQIDDLVEEKLGPSKLSKYISVRPYLLESGKEKLFKNFEI